MKGENRLLSKNVKRTYEKIKKHDDSKLKIKQSWLDDDDDDDDDDGDENFGRLKGRCCSTLFAKQWGKKYFNFGVL